MHPFQPERVSTLLAIKLFEKPTIQNWAAPQALVPDWLLLDQPSYFCHQAGNKSQTLQLESPTSGIVERDRQAGHHPCKLGSSEDPRQFRVS